MNKAELTAKAEGLGLTVPEDAKNADIEKLIADHEAAQEQDKINVSVVKRAKVNRGSTRRITVALSKFDGAMDAFIKEMDLQFFEADESGERVGEWGFVKALKDMRKGVTEAVNAELYPQADAASGE